MLPGRFRSMSTSVVPVPLRSLTLIVSAPPSVRTFSVSIPARSARSGDPTTSARTREPFALISTWSAAVSDPSSCTVSLPVWPSITSAPSPGAQRLRSSPLPSKIRSRPPRPSTTSGPGPASSVSSPRPPVISSAPSPVEMVVGIVSVKDPLVSTMATTSFPLPSSTAIVVTSVRRNRKSGARLVPAWTSRVPVGDRRTVTVSFRAEPVICSFPALSWAETAGPSAMASGALTASRAPVSTRLTPARRRWVGMRKSFGEWCAH